MTAAITTRSARTTRQHAGTETELISIVAGADNVSVDIPQDATLADIEENLRTVVKAYSASLKVAERFSPVIGILIMEVKVRKLYRPDYRNITDYVKRRVGEQMGMGASNAWAAFKIAKAFPTALANPKFRELGAKRLEIAASLTNEKQPDFKKVLEQAAASRTVEAFKGYARERRGAPTEGEETTHTVAFKLPERAFERWQAIREEHGDIEAAEIFVAMMAAYESRRSGVHVARMGPKRSGGRAGPHLKHAGYRKRGKGPISV